MCMRVHEGAFARVYPYYSIISLQKSRWAFVFIWCEYTLVEQIKANDYVVGLYDK